MKFTKLKNKFYIKLWKYCNIITYLYINKLISQAYNDVIIQNKKLQIALLKS